MKFVTPAQTVTWPWLAWLSVVLAGIVAPAIALLHLSNTAIGTQPAWIGGPIFAVGAMGAGIIGAAVARSFRFGILLAILCGTGLLFLANSMGMPGPTGALPIGVALVIASISFAARGALFAESSPDKGWWIAVFVVAGEAALLATASAQPGTLPDWLLALLPAQWANMAIQTALAGAGILAASSALIALSGTAAATLLVARLWPRRWPYLVMFATWLGLSALVYHQPAPPRAGFDQTERVAGLDAR